MRLPRPNVQQWFEHTIQRGVPSLKAEFLPLRSYLPANMTVDANKQNLKRNRYRWAPAGSTRAHWQ
jgi:hypothetical protein